MLPYDEYIKLKFSMLANIFITVISDTVLFPTPGSPLINTILLSNNSLYTFIESLVST